MSLDFAGILRGFGEDFAGRGRAGVGDFACDFAKISREILRA